MAKTIEQYMSKTRADYGSGVARPKIKDKDNFELKGQFLKDLGFLDSRGAIPSKTAADAKTAASGFYQRNNANPSYQERRQSMKDTLSKFMSESAKRHEENSNLIKEIRASTDATIRNQGASIKTLEFQIGQMSKVLQERGFGSLPSSTEANPIDQSAICFSRTPLYEADSYLIRRIGSNQYAVSTGQNRTLIPFPSRLNGYYCEEKKGSYGPQFSEAHSEASYINNSIPRKEKDPGSFTLPCFINNVCFDNAFVDLGASVSVMPLSTYLNLGLGDLAHTKLTVELADRTVKYPKGIAENVLVVLDRPTFEKWSASETKKYAEKSAAEKIQADCDMKATNIILQGLPTDIYSLVNHHRVAKDLWERVQLPMQVNTKFLNSLPPEWSKFVTDVKLVKDLHTTNFDQLHAYLEQHELYANEVRLLRERNHDPLVFVPNQQMTPPHFNTYPSLYTNPQLQQQFSPS
ncbi:mitochondrial proton/calcium exchanger protein-like protein isoform X1 [Tanacetum coccineum]